MPEERRLVTLNSSRSLLRIMRETTISNISPQSHAVDRNQLRASVTKCPVRAFEVFATTVEAWVLFGGSRKFRLTAPTKLAESLNIKIRIAEVPVFFCTETSTGKLCEKRHMSAKMVMVCSDRPSVPMTAMAA